jgi:hypothetical protein
VERYLARAAMTIYTTHVLWDYMGAFVARYLQEVAPLVFWLPPLAACVFAVVVNLAFHHWIVLRSPRLQVLLGVK